MTPPNPQPAMCYVAMRRCGCVMAAVLDKEDYRDTTSKAVASWIKDGLNVSRVTVEFVRDNWQGDDCPHRPGRQLSLMS